MAINSLPLYGCDAEAFILPQIYGEIGFANMKLDDVELQHKTGFVIARGSLKIGSETDAAATDGSAYSRILLSSQQSVTIWPVTQVKRNEYGFCEATLGEIGLAFRSLSLDDIGMLSAPEAGRRSLTRGGSQAGVLVQRVNVGKGWIEKQGGTIQHYELAAEYGSEGLHIEISGRLAPTEGEADKPFSIDTTIPWPTMAVKAMPYSGAYWKFGPQGSRSRLDSVVRSRDPRKLGDLFLDQGLSWPYLKGRISFTPEPSWPPSDRAADDYVSIHFDNNQIGFRDARQLEILDTGFARTLGDGNRHIRVAMFDRERLERTFWQRDAFSLQLAGDVIGSIRYQTGYKDEPGDPFGSIEQPIKTMSLHMALGKEGLEISANGELDEFDPIEFARHREQRDSQLKPLHSYTVQATMPWALLVARGFSFLNRARDF